MSKPKHILRLFSESIKSLLSAHNIEIIDSYLRIKANSSVYDYLGVRVILNSERDCLTAGKLILENYEVLGGRYRDYISKPWSDGYRSIHADIRFKNNLIELQIRTLEMDKFSNELILKYGDHYWRKPGFKKWNGKNSE
jgi:(p)ppGpp synthase/HD superfamily hydrolase